MKQQSYPGLSLPNGLHPLFTSVYYFINGYTYTSPHLDPYSLVVFPSASTSCSLTNLNLIFQSTLTLKFIAHYHSLGNTTEIVLNCT